METKKRAVSIAAAVVFTSAAVWLLYPVISSGSITPDTALSFFFRSAAGFGILVILFGKSLFDLFFPGARRNTRLDMILLVLYSLIIGFSLVVLIGRVLQAVLSRQF